MVLVEMVLVVPVMVENWQRSGMVVVLDFLDEVVKLQASPQ